MGRIVGGMNSDKRGAHRPMQGASAIPWGNDPLRDVQSRYAGGSRVADGAGSGSGRAGTKGKPRQDEGKKHKRPKFHGNHFWRCQKNVIKRCTLHVSSQLESQSRVTR